MLDWESRIDDLAEKLEREYSIDDRLAVEILLGALVACPRTPTSWLVLETNWYARTCSNAWFSFGHEWEPCSLPRLRVRSPWREVEAEMKRMLEEDGNRLFIESDYERYPRFHRLTNANYILQRALRIRTRSRLTSDPLRFIDGRDQARKTDELHAATRYVLDDHAGLRPVDPPKFIEPPNFRYSLELLQRLAPWYPDWNLLVTGFALIAVKRAYLYGRMETDASDYHVMARALADSIPPWIRKALTVLLDGPSKTQTVEKHMQLIEETRRSGHGAHRELMRLHRNGVIVWNKHIQHWAITDVHRQGVANAMNGHSF